MPCNTSDHRGVQRLGPIAGAWRQAQSSVSTVTAAKTIVIVFAGRIIAESTQRFPILGPAFEFGPMSEHQATALAGELS